MHVFPTPKYPRGTKIAFILLLQGSVQQEVQQAKNVAPCCIATIVRGYPIDTSTSCRRSTVHVGWMTRSTLL